MAGEESGGLYIASRCVCGIWLLNISAGWLTLAYQDTGEPVFLPFRMSAYVLSNLVVTAGMLTPGLQV
jgi:hypothetical protein